jgi:hypothetical protein
MNKVCGGFGYKFSMRDEWRRVTGMWHRHIDTSDEWMTSEVSVLPWVPWMVCGMQERKDGRSGSAAHLLLILTHSSIRWEMNVLYSLVAIHCIESVR